MLCNGSPRFSTVLHGSRATRCIANQGTKTLFTLAQHGTQLVCLRDIGALEPVVSCCAKRVHRAVRGPVVSRYSGAKRTFAVSGKLALGPSTLRHYGRPKSSSVGRSCVCSACHSNELSDRVRRRIIVCRSASLFKQQICIRRRAVALFRDCPLFYRLYSRPRPVVIDRVGQSS